MMRGIQIQLRGGLGNQLFQATAMDYFSRKFSCSIRINDSGIIRHSDKSRRSWLRKIDIERMFSNSKLKWSNRFFSQIQTRMGIQASSVALHNEDEINSLIEMENSIRVVGWFQSNHYLPERQIKLEREYINDLSKNVLEFGYRSQQENIGAIHIRLGDFRKTSWGTLQESWYKEAVGLLIESGIDRLDCFSDDIQGARHILKDVKTNIEFNFPEEQVTRNPVDLLWLLSSYKSFVSSNSSLSWWSSYLNRNPSSLIICPWDNHLLMPGWKKL